MCNLISLPAFPCEARIGQGDGYSTPDERGARTTNVTRAPLQDCYGTVTCLLYHPNEGGCWVRLLMESHEMRAEPGHDGANDD